MTHIGRPRDKKSGAIRCDANDAVEAIVAYLEHKLHARFFIPHFTRRASGGSRHRHLDQPRDPGAARAALRRDLPAERPLVRRRGGGRAGAGGARPAAGRDRRRLRERRLRSWQPHCSTVDITRYCPPTPGTSCRRRSPISPRLEPERPFVAVVAGAKYDTKIGPLHEIYKKVDHLILGGVIYNAYLAAKYGVIVDGVTQGDVDAARQLVEMDKKEGKIVELPFVVESDLPDRRDANAFRSRSVADSRPETSAVPPRHRPAFLPRPEGGGGAQRRPDDLRQRRHGPDPHFSEAPRPSTRRSTRTARRSSSTAAATPFRSSRTSAPVSISRSWTTPATTSSRAAARSSRHREGSAYGLAPVKPSWTTAGASRRDRLLKGPICGVRLTPWDLRVPRHCGAHECASFLASSQALLWTFLISLPFIGFSGSDLKSHIVRGGRHDGPAALRDLDPQPLLERFDRLIEGAGYPNRSEAIRDLIRNRLVEAAWEGGTGR